MRVLVREERSRKQAGLPQETAPGYRLRRRHERAFHLSRDDSRDKGTQISAHEKCSGQAKKSRRPAAFAVSRSVAIRLQAIPFHFGKPRRS
jgi:hypothetical protein